MRNQIPTKQARRRKKIKRKSTKGVSKTQACRWGVVGSRERELDWCGGHIGFVGKSKPGHGWVEAGGQQIRLPGAVKRDWTRHKQTKSQTLSATLHLDANIVLFTHFHFSDQWSITLQMAASEIRQWIFKICYFILSNLKKTTLMTRKMLNMEYDDLTDFLLVYVLFTSDTKVQLLTRNNSWYFSWKSDTFDGFLKYFFHILHSDDICSHLLNYFQLIYTWSIHLKSYTHQMIHQNIKSKGTNLIFTLFVHHVAVAFITCVLWIELSFHDSVQRCHYQRAWLVSRCLIRFRVGQVVLSVLPWSTSPPILWALGGSAVSMQSWTIMGKSCWPPAVLWESAALASSAYLDQSGYKWTFTSRQPCEDSPEPSSHISLFNIPYLKRPQFWERGAGGHAFFPFKRAERKQLYVSSGRKTRDVYSSNLDWFSEAFCLQRPCQISDLLFFLFLRSFSLRLLLFFDSLSSHCVFPQNNKIEGKRQKDIDDDGKRIRYRSVNVLTHVLPLRSRNMELHKSILKPSILVQDAFLDPLDHHRYIPYH